MKIRMVHYSVRGKNEIIGGIIIAVLFSLFTIGCILSDRMDDLFAVMVICTLIAMGGVALIVKGVQKINNAKKQSQSPHDFDADAPEFIKERLNEMMYEGVPTTRSVSKTVKRVTITRSDGTSHTTETVTENRTDDKPAVSSREGAVTCQACGGINQLRRGQHGVCEYCGTHIEG